MKIKRSKEEGLTITLTKEETLACCICKTTKSGEWYFWSNPERGGPTCVDCAFGYNYVPLYPGDEEYDFTVINNIEVKP